MQTSVDRYAHKDNFRNYNIIRTKEKKIKKKKRKEKKRKENPHTNTQVTKFQTKLLSTILRIHTTFRFLLNFPLNMTLGIRLQTVHS